MLIQNIFIILMVKGEGEPEGFVNEVDNIIGKTVSCFTLNNGGLGWYPVFDSYAKGKEYLEIDGYYIDHGGGNYHSIFSKDQNVFSKKNTSQSSIV